MTARRLHRRSHRLLPDDRQLRGASIAADTPLFATENRGNLGRMDQPSVFRLVRRLAVLARVPAAQKISPHSLRHFFATDALREKSLHDVQDAMGHADPRTTRRYDRDRDNLAADAALTVGHCLTEHSR